MVEYAYRDLFYKSQIQKDILIVNYDAEVTPVSGQAPLVEDADIDIRTKDIKIESFELNECLCSENNLKWGLCESSSVRFTIKNTKSIPIMHTTNTSRVVNVYIYFNGDSSTLFQVGQYVCESDKYASDRRTRDIELYDALANLWDFDITEWYNQIYAENELVSIYDLRWELFDYLFTEYDFPIEQDEEAELVNDDVEIPKNIESDTITFGFFMQGLLDANGVFGHIGRTGLFEYVNLVKYDEGTVATVVDDFRKPPTTYEDFAVWGIGFVRVYDQNNIQLAYEGSSSYKRPSIYNIIDNFVLTGIYSKEGGADELKTVVANIREQVTHRRYAPMSVEHVGDLCIEVGDNIKVVGDIGEYNTYVLERHLKGLGSMLDTYISRGERKQPKYKVNDKWHGSDSESEEIGTSGYGSGGVSTYTGRNNDNFCEIMRNVNTRFLDEPSNVIVEYDAENMEVSLKWTDPDDIVTNEPVPITWAGTFIQRKENSAPLNIYDGESIVNSIQKNAHSSVAYVDDTIEKNKKYYYGIFPYGTNGVVRFTKVIIVDTTEYLLAPLIISVERV